MKQKILFLHGLESNNKGDKVDFLKERAEVVAPKIDYQDEALEEKLMYIVENFRPDFIIGSSMGGYVGEILAEKYGVPAILFNPALHSRSIKPAIQKPIAGEEADLQERKIVILGKNDKVIDPEITKMMLENNRKYTIIDEETGHQTPLNIFIDTINKYKNEM